MCAVSPQTDALKYTRKNAEVRPFEAGGEGALEHFSRKTDAALFALGSSSKKRPHNIVLGRFYDHRRGLEVCSPHRASGRRTSLLACSYVAGCWQRTDGPLDRSHTCTSSCAQARIQRYMLRCRRGAAFWGLECELTRLK